MLTGSELPGVTPDVPTHLGVRAALSLDILGRHWGREAHIPGRAGFQLVKTS